MLPLFCLFQHFQSGDSEYKLTNADGYSKTTMTPNKLKVSLLVIDSLTSHVMKA